MKKCFFFFGFHRLGCCLMKDSVPVDLIVVLQKILLDLIKLYEMSCTLNRIMCLFGVIPLIDLIFLCASSFFIGTSDTTQMSEDDADAGITGEITVASLPSRLIAGVGSSVGTGTLSGEVVDFLKEFDRKTPNPHLEQHFWNFNGPLVPFDGFWVPKDCLPYLQRLSTEHGNFTIYFKLSAGLGGPMLSLLGSVMTAMNESNLEI
jgi:hypothetical protein